MGWDLSVKELDPIVVLDTTASGTKLTSVTFSSKTNAVLYGDSDGKITVAMLKKFLADLATLQPKRQSCSALSPRTRRRGLVMVPKLTNKCVPCSVVAFMLVGRRSL